MSALFAPRMLATQIGNPRCASRFGALQDVPLYSELKAVFTASASRLGDNSFSAVGAFVHLLFGFNNRSELFRKTRQDDC